MTEGSVSEWLKIPGDLVRKGEMLFIVSTDKADMEVESLDEGHLAQIVVQPGTVVPVGTVIAYLGQPGEVVATSPVAEATGHAAPDVQQNNDRQSPAATVTISSGPEASLPGEGGLPSSPRARKLARELGVDITKVGPTGARSRIVESDVQKYAESLKSRAVSGDARRRRVIAERLTQSVQTIPHFSLNLEVRADRLVALHQSLKAPGPDPSGPKITVTDLILKALALALVEVPAIRAVWENGDLRAIDAIDLGLAIAADSGVVAPVLRKAADAPFPRSRGGARRRRRRRAAGGSP
jgi:pyruvate dehydrogenase E2 component (dihydrolipoamide acetyltransferase)